MIDRELEQRLRVWYHGAVPEGEGAPRDLRDVIAAIPTTAPAPLRALPRRRGTALLAVAAILLVGGAAAAGSGWFRLLTTIRPSPSVALLAAEPSSGPSSIPTDAPTPSPAPVLRDGDLIAFTGLVQKATTTCFFGRTSCPTARLSIVGADGQDAHEVFPDGTGHQQFLDWTPDGSRILYADDGRLLLADPRGGVPEAVDTGCAAAAAARPSSCLQDSQVAISLDGRHLAFVRDSADASGEDRSVIATMDLVTGQVATLAATLPDGGAAPRLSPDGSGVVFYRPGTKDLGGPVAPVKAGVFVVAADGTGLRQISPPTIDAMEPDWSPDGGSIVFLSPGADGGTGDLYTIRPDGTRLQRLTTSGTAATPSWIPDGRILYASVTNNGGERTAAGWWAMDADGSNATLVVPASTVGLGPAGGARMAWQPLGGAAIVPPPWTPVAAVDAGPPAPTPAPTPLPDLAAGFSWAGTSTTNDGSPLGETATLLRDGRVLLAGGCGTAAELYDPATGTFPPTGSLTVPRGGGSATLLQDGQVLFAGGYDCGRAGEDGIWRSAELYDPATGTFHPTGSMTVPRERQTATLLADGRVLITGGLTGPEPSAARHITLASVRTIDTSSNVLSSAEVYDPATGTFSTTGSMSAFRDAHTATLLQDGRVLVVGGGGEGYASRASAELYDPVTGRFSKTGSLKSGRWLHRATLLQDGRVLVTGGRSPKDSVYRSAEIFDPRTGRFSAAGQMGEGRQSHTATLLPDGRVLIAGGYWSDGQRWRVLSSAEIYDPTSGDFTTIGSMGSARDGHTATLLGDGRVLIVGGTGIGVRGGEPVTSAVLYQP